VLTHKLPYRLELVEMDELAQAGQALDPEREIQESDMSGAKLESCCPGIEEASQADMPWNVSICDRECSIRHDWRVKEEKLVDPRPPLLPQARKKKRKRAKESKRVTWVQCEPRMKGQRSPDRKGRQRPGEKRR
jgi:hypothetical protein